MAQQYDSIATAYATAKKRDSHRVDIEYYTFLHRLLLPALGINNGTVNDISKFLSNKRVLDLGCGDGHYTRKLKELGCEVAVGVDISSNMIAIAHAQEQAHPLGITYYVSDTQCFPRQDQQFDLVVAFFLLNYAKTSEELTRMVRAIGEQLADNKNNSKCYFLSMTSNVCGGKNTFNTDIHRKYGFIREAQMPLVDGAEVKYTCFNPDGSTFSFITFYLSPEIYEQAFEEAGFTHFEWVPVEAASGKGNFYDDYMKNPTMIGIMASK